MLASIEHVYLTGYIRVTTLNRAKAKLAEVGADKCFLAAELNEWR
jgi:hypothetical protein